MIPFKKVLSHRGVQVAFTLLLYLTLAPLFPPEIPRLFYTITLLMKDLLLWILPITISFFIASAVASFEKKAPLFLITLLCFEAFFNTASVWYAFGCSQIAATFSPPLTVHSIANSLEPLWRLPFSRPPWWSADKGSFVGVLLGLIAMKAPLTSFISQGKHLVEQILTKGFAKLISLFILGFIAKIHATHLLSQIAFYYLDLLLWMAAFLALYISALFFLGSRGSPLSFAAHVKNLLPAGSIAFSSGCSLSTMPWTIEGCKKNLQNKSLASSIIPATTNIQQVGDCIINAFLCALIYRQFHGHLPSLELWIPFSLVFMLARFATAAVLGGAMFIMLPLYETYLHFSAEMMATILAFNVILDPLVTCTNVLGNGALCRLFEKVWNQIAPQEKKTVSSKEH